MTQLKILSHGLKKEKYWYKTILEHCPVCGQENTYKYRVYGIKPKNYEDRLEYRYINHYCYL